MTTEKGWRLLRGEEVEVTPGEVIRIGDQDFVAPPNATTARLRLVSASQPPTEDEAP